MQHLNTASSTWRRRRRRTLLLFTLCSVLHREERGRGKGEGGEGEVPLLEPVEQPFYLRARAVLCSQYRERSTPTVLGQDHEKFLFEVEKQRFFVLELRYSIDRSREWEASPFLPDLMVKVILLTVLLIYCQFCKSKKWETLARRG